MSKEQIELIGRWIDQGAKWQKHWSFIPPTKATIPAGQSAIDFFVRQRLAKQNLTPSSSADRRTLIRRVSLDLTGLPPTPEEVAAFLNDQSPKAYEKVLDRLLA